MRKYKPYGWNLVCLLLLSTLIVACGGGSGGDRVQNASDAKPEASAASQQGGDLGSTDKPNAGTDSQTPLPSLYKVDQFPQSNARAQPVDQVVRLEFSVELAVEKVSSTHFALDQVWVDRHGHQIKESIPFEMSINDSGKIVELQPTMLYRKNATVTVSAFIGLPAKNGNTLSRTDKYVFYTEFDQEGPTIISVDPVGGYHPINAVRLNLNPSFVVTMSEPVLGIESDFISNNVLLENSGNSSSGYRWIPTRIVVDGSTITVTTEEPLNYDDDYMLLIRTLDITDEYGNSVRDSVERLAYKTKHNPNSLKLPSKMTNLYYDAPSHALLAFTPYRQLLFRVALGEQMELSWRGLPNDPVDACITHNGHLAVTFLWSSTVRVYDMSSMTQLSEFDWTESHLNDLQREDLAFFSTPKIECVGEFVYVSRGDMYKNFLAKNRVSLAPPHQVDVLSNSAALGDLVKLADGNLLARELNAVGIPTNVLKLLHETSDGFTDIGRYEPTLNYAQRTAHLIVDEESRQLFLANSVMHLDSLPNDLHRLPGSQSILAVDSIRKRFYTNRGLYDSTTYEQLLGAIVPGASHAWFDKFGNLVIFNDETLLVHVIDKQDLH